MNRAPAGRPPKFRQCTGPCARQLPARAYKDKNTLECRDCRGGRLTPEARTDWGTLPIGVLGPILEAAAASPTPEAIAKLQSVAIAPELKRALLDSISIAETARAAAAIVANFCPPACKCCHDIRDVAPDPVGGAMLCPVCMFSIIRCGRCAPQHGTGVFYEHLTANPVPDVPVELLQAYGYVPALPALEENTVSAPLDFA